MNENVKRGNTAFAVKVGAWYFLSTFLVKGLTFITTPIFSRLMSKEAYGEFSNFANWLSLLLVIVSVELYSTLSRAYYDYTEEYDRYASSVMISGGIITLFFYILFLLNGSWIFNIVSIPPEYVHVLFLALLCQTCKQTFLARERTLYRYKTVALLSVIDLVIPTLLALILVATAQDADRLSARLYGFYIPSAAVGLVCAFLVLRKGRSFRLSHVKYGLKLSLPLMAHYLTAHLLTSSNVFVTKNILGAATSAYFSITSSVTHIFTIMFQSLSGAITTWLMDNLNQKNEKEVRKYTLYYVGLIALVASGVILIAPEVIWILGGNKYKEAIWLIPALVFGVAIQSTTSIFTIILTYAKKVTKTAVFSVIVTVLCIAAKILMIKPLGYQSLSFTNVAAFSALFVVNYILVRKAGYAKAINIKGILAVLAAAAIVAAGSYALYLNSYVRYGVILLFAAAFVTLVIVKRKTIIETVRRIRRK